MAGLSSEQLIIATFEHLRRNSALGRGVSVMGLRHERCLHCSILDDIGRQLETGTIDGQRALDNLVRVMADILAAAPPNPARGMMAGIIQILPAAEAHARERMKRETALQRRHG